MKKLFYTLVIAIASMMTFTSCTEEDVAPTIETNNGGMSGDPGGLK